MPELSPAAQAVWDAYELVDCDEFKIDPRRAGLAAALRAAANKLSYRIIYGGGECEYRIDVFDLLAIVAELEAQ